MILNVGLTGGIGSGKSVISKLFELIGVPVLDSDRIAKMLMQQDVALIEAIKEEFGNHIYHEGKLDRAYLARIVFNNTNKLKALNALVHPATILYSKQWAQQQVAPYVIKEAALFFESGSYADMDVIIGVFAPQELRIKRVMERDNVGEQEVMTRIEKQMPEEEKMKLCDYVIFNDESQSLIEQVVSIHNLLLKKNKAKNNHGIINRQ